MTTTQGAARFWEKVSATAEDYERGLVPMLFAPWAVELVDLVDPHGAFDVAVCQQGLQFFPDRLAALVELHRVVAPGGRVAISTWCDPCAPGYAPFRSAFEQYLPDLPAARGFLAAIFSLDDAAELRDLLAEAGFTDVRVDRRTHDVRAASADAWATAFLTAAPVPGLADYDADALARITADVVDSLRPYVHTDGLSFPISSLVAVAGRP
jgi:SAM-dependent methyltransferase